MKRSEVDRTKLSPMMAQYMEIKDKYPDTLLFYRLGDFYELFFDDGEIASRELGLTLTGRASGLEEKAPMCGVPHHAVKTYIEKLVNKGYKVAICEQLEDPRFTKGMVKRGVIDVISKGTIADLELLDSTQNSYIASLLDFPDIYLLTLLDISTGKLISISLLKDKDKLINTILSYQIKEIIVRKNIDALLELKSVNDNIQIDYSEGLKDDINEHLKENISDVRCLMGVKHLFYFLESYELKDLEGITNINIINPDDYLQMDVHAITNLELVETIRSKERINSLIWFLDKCATAMGSRKLKDYLLNPILNETILNDRYDKIEKLNTEFILRDNLKECLNEVYDIERLTGKVTNGSLNARDLVQLKKSLSVLPEIKDIISKLKFDYDISTFDDITKELELSLVDTPPITVKEGGMIKSGYSSELDELKSIRSGGKEFVSSFENTIREKTGIKSLKVGFNRVFGYYIEVSKGQVGEIKEEFGFERRQTLANCERFISPELKEKEDMILNAEEKIIDLEYELFNHLKDMVKEKISDIRIVADYLSEIDAILSLAIVADNNHLVRPTLNHNHIIDIKDGFHPVVSLLNKNTYVNNDCHMDENVQTLLITGPNMSGKSTYMRQIAITVIMAQMGSFVPCKSANLPIIDKIFTRIGASDDLTLGQSTFMVEMMEANNAIKNATENSLILFDELGRGTATYDGISLARAILEYVHDHIKCKTLFSTHYHELTVLEKEYSEIKNVHVDATEEGGRLIFLHKVKNGSIDKSYGVHVASLAGMPNELIKRADEILSSYEDNKKTSKESHIKQLSFNMEEKKEVIDPLKDIDPLNLTPMEALNLIYKIKNENQNK